MTFKIVLLTKNGICFYSKNEEKGKNIVPGQRLAIERYVCLTDPKVYFLL